MQQQLQQRQSSSLSRVYPLLPAPMAPRPVPPLPAACATTAAAPTGTATTSSTNERGKGNHDISSSQYKHAAHATKSARLPVLDCSLRRDIIVVANHPSASHGLRQLLMKHASSTTTTTTLAGTDWMVRIIFEAVASGRRFLLVDKKNESSRSKSMTMMSNTGTSILAPRQILSKPDQYWLLNPIQDLDDRALVVKQLKNLRRGIVAANKAAAAALSSSSPIQTSGTRSISQKHKTSLDKVLVSNNAVCATNGFGLLIKSATSKRRQPYWKEQLLDTITGAGGRFLVKDDMGYKYNVLDPVTDQQRILDHMEYLANHKYFYNYTKQKRRSADIALENEQKSDPLPFIMTGKRQASLLASEHAAAAKIDFCSESPGRDYYGSVLPKQKKTRTGTSQSAVAPEACYSVGHASDSGFCQSGTIVDNLSFNSENKGNVSLDQRHAIGHTEMVQRREEGAVVQVGRVSIAQSMPADVTSSPTGGEILGMASAGLMLSCLSKTGGKEDATSGGVTNKTGHTFAAKDAVTIIPESPSLDSSGFITNEDGTKLVAAMFNSHQRVQMTVRTAPLVSPDACRIVREDKSTDNMLDDDYHDDSMIMDDCADHTILEQVPVSSLKGLICITVVFVAAAMILFHQVLALWGDGAH